MIVVGIHMGHDASVSVVVDGRIVNCIERERIARFKHCGVITAREIRLALEDAGVDHQDIGCFAISNTQNWPFMFLDRESFSFDYTNSLGFLEGRIGDGLRTAIVERHARCAEKRPLAAERLRHWRKDAPFGAFMADDVGALDPRADVLFHEELPAPDARWSKAQNHRDIAALTAADLADSLAEEARYACAAPVEVTFLGRRHKGFVVSHHAAHAATAFYLSNFDRAGILTVDNGGATSITGYTGGYHFYGEGNRIVPLWPNYVQVGGLYHRVAVTLGLGALGGAGKLMGLAPYGKPRYTELAFLDRLLDGRSVDPTAIANEWLQFVRGKAARDGVVDSGLSLADADSQALLLAASTQRLFEETMLAASSQLAGLLDKAAVGTRNLCLAGGCALNCPTNSRLYNESRFRNVFVPPCCDDTGVAVGAALLVSHSILDVPRAAHAATSSGLAYLGRRIPERAVAAALEERAGEVLVSRPQDAAGDAARLLADNKVVAWYEGRSEIGPRALGHRSILADPRRPDNWSRVNRIKSREPWRPFAPAVLAEHADAWFAGCPPRSPFMLFTARVKARELPATTHVDGSARLQTVTGECGEFHRVIEHFHHETNVPVVLNTSFNGPGEPIVDHPRDALAMFAGSTLDALYLEGYKVEKPA